jgi:hypothetical protein
MATPPSSSADAATHRGELPCHSESPRRRWPSPSPMPRRRARLGHRDQSAAPPCMVKEVSGQFPLLTKTNYSNWAAMLRARGLGLWAAVKEGMADDVEDQMAMEALFCGVPLEMAASLASKPSTKVAWDHLESSHLGSNRTCMVSAQRVRRLLESVSCIRGLSCVC